MLYYTKTLYVMLQKNTMTNLAFFKNKNRNKEENLLKCSFKVTKRNINREKKNRNRKRKNQTFLFQIN